MAKTFSKSGISEGYAIEAWHVTQSLDAFTGAEEYNIHLSGSLSVTGSVSATDGFIGDIAGTAIFATNAGSAITSDALANQEYKVSSTPHVGAATIIAGSGTLSLGTFTSPVYTSLAGKTIGVDVFITANYIKTVAIPSSGSLAVSLNTNAVVIQEVPTGNSNAEIMWVGIIMS